MSEFTQSDVNKKQPVVTWSSAEAKYRALLNDNCEGMWLQRLLKELQVERHMSVELMCDNKASNKYYQEPCSS